MLNHQQNNSSNNDPDNWFLGVFYFNKADKRLLSPKRFPFMGWTINFANPLSVLFLISLVLLVIVISLVFTPTH